MPNHRELNNAQTVGLFMFDAHRLLTTSTGITCITTFGNVVTTFTSWSPEKKDPFQRILNRRRRSTIHEVLSRESMLHMYLHAVDTCELF